MSEFKWRHFEGEIILWAVRWYCRYGISYRDLEQMMGERGVAVDHSTIYRWCRSTRRRSKSDCAGSGAARSRRVGESMKRT
jgi:transposase-like protein